MNGAPKLNYKRIAAALVCIAVAIMIIVSIVKIINNDTDNKKEPQISYYTVYSDNNKWGVINNSGKVIIEPKYDEMIAIPNKEKPVFIYTYDVNDEGKTYKTKAINDKEETLFTDYDKVEPIDNFDSKQNIWYENDVLKVVKDNKYGLIDLDGNEILSCEYNDISALKSVPGDLVVTKDGKKGLIDKKGQTIIKTEYKDILPLEEGYKKEYIVVNDEDKGGIVSTSGKVVIQPEYDKIQYCRKQ